MAQTVRSRQSRSTGKSEYRRSVSRSAYVAGNTVRQIDVVEEIHKPRRHELSHAVKKNRDKAVYMNLGYVLFLTASLIVAGVVLIGYIRLQSEITASVKHIAAMESTLNSLKVSNDEEYSRIESSVDLDGQMAGTQLPLSFMKLILFCYHRTKASVYSGNICLLYTSRCQAEWRRKCI